MFMHMCEQFLQELEKMVNGLVVLAGNGVN